MLTIAAIAVSWLTVIAMYFMAITDRRKRSY